MILLTRIMKRLLYLFTVVLLSLQIHITFAQDINKLQEQLFDYASNHPQEKIHVHTDRNLYSAGETIWYKAYTVIDIENQLSTLSNLVHIDLIDPKGSIIASRLHANISGLSSGDIELTDTLVEGSYRLRAYTNWMRNDSSYYFFEKVIEIGNMRTDELFTNVSLVSMDGIQYYQIKVNNTDGSLLPKTAVRYDIFDQNKPVDKGRATLNENGEILIKVDNKNRGKGILLSIKKPDRRTIKKYINGKSFFSENDVQFFPEGGNYLSNELNKIAFKATNPQGRGIPATVNIITNSNDTAGRVKSNELGMAATTVFLSDNTTYRAEVKFNDGSTKTVALPTGAKSGYNMLVATNFNKIYTQVNLTEDHLNGKDIYIIYQHLGKVFYIAKQLATKKNLTFIKEQKDLPTGVITISILDHMLTPVAERAYFNNKSYKTTLQVTLDKNSYSKRSKVSSDIILGTTVDSLTTAALSASVVNLSHIGTSSEEGINILSSLLLQADVKGYIERPSFYFNADGSYKTEDLDRLLLTQGWRKIAWKNLDSLDKKPKFQAEKAINLAGFARKIGRKAPVPNAKIQLISTNNYMEFIDTVANENGYFEFNNLIFPDSIKFIVSARDQKDKKNIDLSLVNTPPAEINQERNGPLLNNSINSLFKNELLANSEFYTELEKKGLMDKTIQIEEVIVRAVRPKAAEHSSNLNRPGNADQVITAEELSSCPNLEACLNGRLFGVIFRNGKPYMTRGNDSPMQIIVDGMYTEADMLSMISAQDVESVEVLKSVSYTSVYGMYGGNGVLIITTKRGGGFATNSKPTGMLVAQPQGLSLVKEFYKPVYEPNSTSGFQRDLRTTIHWEPNIITTKDGKAHFDFYTSDEAGTYRITLEGIDLKGNLYRRVTDFDVK
ncbi:TonB-dependent receptor plug domain-containing protein [Sphingobacterium sp. DK4209]|uniref:TonB-dependent receptor plug domain-containing protein n=2 Tax=Sphingobacterium zhuxiongii TaxID=2662364 RepID=A0A5Q0Q674_9SPHI|nr:TonB-dependent receptor plug domain-containing protein [Sphingobacterium sp. DK4209]QGA24856.1 TonB-dependent receptor plug domain-containing protein [Sphingobacterium sp. dk4302]